MIRMRSLRDGKIESTEGVEALAVALRDDAPDWISVAAPTEEELAALGRHLSLHRLALRDALNENQPAKLEDYGDHLFFVLSSPVKQAFSQTRRVSVFLSQRWIVTMHRTESDAMDAIAARVEEDPEHLLQSPDALAHVVLDHMMGGFEELTADILAEMIELEDRVLGDPSPASMEAILKMRRRVIGLLRVTRNQRDVCASLCRMRHDALSPDVVPFLRDVYDHILRVYELLESAREGMAVTRDAYLAVVNNRLSEIMRTLTIIATVMMPLSLVAGIYGMNFEVMPMLANPAGFWVTMGVMLAVAVGMLTYFRARKWF